MKIAQLTCVYPPYRSGMGTSAANTARFLASAGNEIATFTPRFKKVSGAPAYERSEESGSLFRLGTLLKLGNAACLPQLFWRLAGCDLVFLNYPFFGTAEIAWFLKKFVWRGKKKLVIHYHMDVAPSGFFTKLLMLPADLIFNSLFSAADLILTGSLDYIKNSRLAGFYEKHPERFSEIPYPVDIERFRPLGLEEQKGSGRPFNVFFVGGLDRAHYFKGVEILLEAFAGLCQEGKEMILNIDGTGDLLGYYREKAGALGILEKVIFFGNSSPEELPARYRQADVLVLPSINKGEAFGIVLIEAMASGVPVIASDLPGVRSVFEDGVQGLACQAGSVASLKDKLRYLIDNPSKREEMAAAARRLAEERYDQRVVGENLNKMISAVCDKRPAARS